jgi:glycosyltransferase involved in cell wall biosynthesis
MSAPCLPLSAVIITLNCARQLEACLDSLGPVDELIVVDSGSDDGTIALAQRRGARVSVQEWIGFGPQKQRGIEQASCDWVLCIDADERLSGELRASIAEALAGPRFRAYEFARCNRFMGRYLRHGEGYPDWSLRLFDRRAARWSSDPVHEKVETEGAVGRLRGDLLHDSAESLDGYLAKQNRYTSLAAQAFVAQGRTAHVGHLLLSPWVRFVKFFFFRLGLLDGVPGLVHTLIGCSNSFVKYAKILDLQGRKKA